MSRCGALIDTGPLVAFLNRSDRFHSWARAVFAEVPGPYATSEANLAEVGHLLERVSLKGSLRLFEILETGMLQVETLHDSLPSVHAQVARFKDRRVDFADACLLVLAERASRLPLMTVDRADFTVYFRGKRQRLILPPL